MSLSLMDLSLIFIKVQVLQIVLRATQALDALIFCKILPDVTSFLADTLSGLKKIMFRPEAIT